MNILIVRAFIRMRELMSSNKDIAARVEKLERGHDRTASVIEVLVEEVNRREGEGPQLGRRQRMVEGGLVRGRFELRIGGQVELLHGVL